MRVGDVAIWVIGIGAVLVVTAVVVGLFLFLATLFTGTYSYEYRCTDHVVEKRLEWWGFVPMGGFEPIDGDPVGGCQNSP